MNYKKILTLVLFNFYINSAIAASPYQNMVVFGDSLSDTGNNTWVVTEGKIGAPVTNQDTQGASPLWISNLNDFLFPGSRLYSSRDLSTLALNPYTQNINYAYASAETGIDYLNDAKPNQAFPPYDNQNCAGGPGLVAQDLSCVPGVRKQVELYLSDVNHKPNPKTLFIIWAGGNDLFNNLTKTVLSHQPASDIALSNGSDPINNIVQARNALLNAGVTAQQIYVLDMPDLALTPVATNTAQNNPAFLKLFHQMSLTFNRELKQALTLSKNKIPESHVLSVYDLFNNILKKQDEFGFVNIKDSCVTNGLTPLCDGYVFFNDKHPTVQMGIVLADQLKEAFKNE